MSVGICTRATTLTSRRDEQRTWKDYETFCASVTALTRYPEACQFATQLSAVCSLNMTTLLLLLRDLLQVCESSEPRPPPPSPRRCQQCLPTQRRSIRSRPVFQVSSHLKFQRRILANRWRPNFKRSSSPQIWPISIGQIFSRPIFCRQDPKAKNFGQIFFFPRAIQARLHTVVSHSHEQPESTLSPPVSPVETSKITSPASRSPAAFSVCSPVYCRYKRTL